MLSVLAGCSAEPGSPSGPAFDCQQVESGSMESRICRSESLAALDRQLSRVYRQARTVAESQPGSMLVAEQRGWIKGRNDCWKSADPDRCMADSYRQRIVTLQAEYELVEAGPWLSFRCQTTPSQTLRIRHYATSEPTLVADYNGQRSLMTRQPSGSGVRYRGRNESLWEHQGEVRLTWGYQAEAVVCQSHGANH
ncbi:MliC family protein [Ferrimonas kyonanensis]|uniref:MliC family protein n=1 Tax=Ferrimonas kyonanensis TaxID=364763 RepID=UPI00146A1FF5|nr:MliC family protein [Ferrimonas kyonanensis]